jgi:hypothetical protein
VANPEKEKPNEQVCWDSLNADLVEVTKFSHEDWTRRPMSEKLRKQLKLPPRPEPPAEPRPDSPAP